MLGGGGQLPVNSVKGSLRTAALERDLIEMIQSSIAQLWVLDVLLILASDFYFYFFGIQ